MRSVCKLCVFESVHDLLSIEKSDLFEKTYKKAIFLL